MTDRNAVEDLQYVIAHLSRDAYTEELCEIRDYWYENPREPWGAVTILRRGTSILVVQGPKGMGLPGGKGERGETPMQGAFRELFEETGLRAAEYRQLPSFEADNGVLTHAFLVTHWSGELCDSKEGYPCWVEPSVLCSPWARFPRYNRRILEEVK